LYKKTLGVPYSSIASDDITKETPGISLSRLFNSQINAFPIPSTAPSVTKPAYQIRYLKSDGKIITKDQYDSMLQNGQSVFIVAFLGCTYQCG